MRGVVRSAIAGIERGLIEPVLGEPVVGMAARMPRSMESEMTHSRQQHRGPGAEKVELERRLDANAEVERRGAGIVDDGDAADGAALQGATPRGHKSQLGRRGGRDDSDAGSGAR
jgi:hypothetical protein